MTSPEPPWDAARLALCAQAIEQRFGLYFPEKRQSDLERGLRQAFASSTCQDPDEYYGLVLDARAGALEMDRLVNALTVGETHFLRDAGQFDALYHHVLPQLIERRRPVRTLRLWSAGCASGEEPYSLAMMLRELLPDVDEWAITILGSDINTEALHRARTAVYGEWAFREERARQWRSRYFRPVDNRWELVPEVRRMVAFQQLNLAGNGYPSFETNTTYLDLVLCRNVTIYFGEMTTRQVVDRLYDSLSDGGWLVVGHAEPSPLTYQRFQMRSFPNACLYQKTGQPGRQPDAWQPPAPGTPGPAPATILPSAPAGEGDPLLRAGELLEYGYPEKARDLLLEVAARRPGDAQASSMLGQACANLGQWDQAEQWCRRAIQADKLALEAYYTLSLVLQHRARLPEALDAMKKVVYIDRHSILGHFGLADLYHSHGQWPQALKALDNAHRLLSAMPAEEVITRSGGITAGRLLATVVIQQQQWQAEAQKR